MYLRLSFGSQNGSSLDDTIGFSGFDSFLNALSNIIIDHEYLLQGIINNAGKIEKEQSRI